MAICQLGDLVPAIDPEAYVHPDAVIIGDVAIGPESSVWPHAVLRGDYGTITVGARSSIQDGSVVLHHAVIGTGATVGANAVVPSNMEVPAGSLALGVPATVRPDRSNLVMIQISAAEYVANGHHYRGQLERLA